MPKQSPDDKDPARTSTIPHIQPEPRPDFSPNSSTTPSQRKPLPAPLQKTLDSEDSLWTTLTTGQGQESTETDYRYAAYASRVRTILLSAHRYVAYTSDIGESFRPIAHPWLIRGAYGVSWAYLIGDVSHEGYKAYLRNQRVLGLAPPAKVEGVEREAEMQKGEHSIPATAIAAAKDLPSTSTAPAPPAGMGKVAPLDDYRTVMAQRAIFQGLASMGLPAFTIHSIVRYSGRALKGVKNQKIRTWGPIGLGLAAVPALPFLFDEPVERGVEFVFHRGFEMVGMGGGGGGEKEKEKEKEL